MQQFHGSHRLVKFIESDLLSCHCIHGLVNYVPCHCIHGLVNYVPCHCIHGLINYVPCHCIHGLVNYAVVRSILVLDPLIYRLRPKLKSKPAMYFAKNKLWK